MTQETRWKRIAIVSMTIAAAAVLAAAYGSRPESAEAEVAPAAAARSGPSREPSRSLAARIAERVRETITGEESYRIPAGTTVSARITSHVSSRDALRGDPVTAVTTEDLFADGALIFPSGTPVRGTVTEVAPASQTRSAAVLRVSFHRIGDRSADLSLSSPDLEARARNANRAADAALVVGGVVAGAVIGNQTNARRGKELGAVIGGASGAVAAANFGANVQLLRNEPAVLRFSRDLVETR